MNATSTPEKKTALETINQIAINRIGHTFSVDQITLEAMEEYAAQFQPPSGQEKETKTAETVEEAAKRYEKKLKWELSPSDHFENGVNWSKDKMIDIITDYHEGVLTFTQALAKIKKP